MLKMTIEFTEPEAERFFESNGIKLIRRPVPALFGSDKAIVYVRNPANGGEVLLERAFNAVMATRTKQLLLTDIDKLTIYTTLNNLK